MENLKRKRGITLIALVITIIVLLILAGVSLSLIAGENGILKRSTTAVEKNKKASATEQAELLVADYVAEFFEKKYNEEEMHENAGKYVQNALSSGKNSGNYFVKTNGEKITVYPKEGDETAIVSGTIESNGQIDWTEKKQISFTIEGVEYTTTEGTTWGELLLNGKGKYGALLGYRNKPLENTPVAFDATYLGSSARC